MYHFIIYYVMRWSFFDSWHQKWSKLLDNLMDAWQLKYIVSCKLYLHHLGLSVVVNEGVDNLPHH